MFFALLRFDDRDPADPADEFESHVGDGGGAVEASLLFHLVDDVLDGLFFILVEAQRVFDAGVSFDEFMSGEPQRDARVIRMVFDEMHDRVEGPVDRAAVVALVAEVPIGGLLLITGHMDRVAHEFVDAFAGQRVDGDDRDAEGHLEFIDVDCAAVVDDFIEEVQGDDHGPVQLEELHRKVQVALDVRAVDDVDDAFRLLPQDELAGDDLLAGVRGHRIDARKVRDEGLRMLLDLAVFPVHGDAGEVSDVLVGTGQLIEERRFAAVLVSGQREGQGLPLRQRRLVLLVVVASAFAEARVFHVVAAAPGHGRPVLTDRRLLLIARTDGDTDVRGIRQTKAQLIAVDAQFHRVSQGRVADQFEPGAGQDAHVEKMLSERAAATHPGDDSGLADF